MNPIAIAVLALAGAPDPSPSAPTDGSAPVPADPSATAAELFASAEQDMAQARYESALEKLRRADELLPHPATKFHMARCLEALGRLREAWELFGVVAEHAEVSPAERTAAAQRRAETRSRLATVHVTAPEGGRVLVDGEPRCETSCTVLVDPGNHDVRVVWPDREVGDRVELAESEVHEIEIGAPAPPPVLATPPPPRAPPRDASPAGQRRAAAWPTAWTWVGAPLAGLGTIGTIAFGSRTLAVRREHESDPSSASRDRGLRLRAATNASIAVAIGGGVLLLVDAIRYGVAKRRRSRPTP